MDETEPQLNPYAAPTTPGEVVAPPTDVMSGQLRLAAIGLRMIYGGLLGILVAWIGMIGVSLLGVNSGPAAAVFVIVSMIALVVINLGPLLCLSVPTGYGLRSFAMAAVVTQFCAIACFVATFVLGSAIFNFGVLALSLAAASLFLMFLYRLAQQLRRTDLVRRSRNVGVLGAVVTFGVFPATWFGAVIDADFQVAMVMAIGVIAGTVLAIVMYANLVNALAKAISSP